MCCSLCQIYTEVGARHRTCCKGLPLLTKIEQLLLSLPPPIGRTVFHKVIWLIWPIAGLSRKVSLITCWRYVKLLRHSNISSESLAERISQWSFVYISGLRTKLKETLIKATLIASCAERNTSRSWSRMSFSLDPWFLGPVLGLGPICRVSCCWTTPVPFTCTSLQTHERCGRIVRSAYLESKGSIMEAGSSCRSRPDCSCTLLKSWTLQLPWLKLKSQLIRRKVD